MAELFDFNAFKNKKNLDRLVPTHQEDVENVTEENFYDYVTLMKVVVTGQTIKMGTLHMNCLADHEVYMVDDNNQPVDYLNFFSEYGTEEEAEDEDLIMSTLIHKAPQEIVITNSKRLNKHLLFAITQIFHTRTTIKS